MSAIDLSSIPTDQQVIDAERELHRENKRLVAKLEKLQADVLGWAEFYKCEMKKFVRDDLIGIVKGSQKD